MVLILAAVLGLNGAGLLALVALRTHPRDAATATASAKVIDAVTSKPACD